MSSSVQGNDTLRVVLNDKQDQLRANRSILECLLANCPMTKQQQSKDLLTMNEKLTSSLQSLEAQIDEVQSTALLQHLSQVSEEERLLIELQEDFEVTQNELIQAIQAKGKQLAIRRKAVAKRKDYLETVRRTYKIDARTASHKSLAFLSQVEQFKEEFRCAASGLFQKLGALRSLQQEVSALEREVTQARVLVHNPVNRRQVSLSEALASLTECEVPPQRNYFDQAKEVQPGLSLPSESPRQQEILELKAEVQRMGKAIEGELQELLTLQKANDFEREYNRMLIAEYMQKSRQTDKFLSTSRTSLQTAGSLAELGV